jgi:hypothetical protein
MRRILLRLKDEKAVWLADTEAILKAASPSYSRKAARSRGPRRDFARAAWPVDRVE